MRPIDADALKYKNLAEVNGRLTYVLTPEEINSAPPIELTETEIQKVLNKRCMTVVPNEYLIGLHGKRPHGEWLIVKDKKWGDSVKCPFCGKELAGTDLNFCCKCGAQMKGGAT